jgi:hypothetical protein
LPELLKEAYATFEPRGIGVLDVLVEAARRQTTTTAEQPGFIAAMDPERVMPLMACVSPNESDRLIVILERFVAATDAQLQQAEGYRDLARQLLGLIKRARQLEPGLPEELSLGAAVKVLRRHGEPVGLSDEVLHARWAELFTIEPVDGLEEEE